MVKIDAEKLIIRITAEYLNSTIQVYLPDAYITAKSIIKMIEEEGKND